VELVLAEMRGMADAKVATPVDVSGAKGGRGRDGEAQRSLFEIVARQDFSDVTYLLEFHHPQMARAARPGQFVIVILHEGGERIPLTIAGLYGKFLENPNSVDAFGSPFSATCWAKTSS
jgi:hypothetical protein|tara:strand:- start:1357 stop:1713 length:357 start_codon:yes stop_codon:yes gene_type:complete